MDKNTRWRNVLTPCLPTNVHCVSDLCLLLLDRVDFFWAVKGLTVWSGLVFVQMVASCKQSYTFNSNPSWLQPAVLITVPVAAMHMQGDMLVVSLDSLLLISSSQLRETTSVTRWLPQSKAVSGTFSLSERGVDSGEPLQMHGLLSICAFCLRKGMT